MIKVLGVFLATALVVLPAGASAGPPGYDTYDVSSASLRDASGDVLRSDGNATYSGREVGGTRIADFTDPASSDRFNFLVDHKRTVNLQHPLINGGQPTECNFDFTVFTSHGTPNWYDLLSTGAASVVLSDTFILCNMNSGVVEWTITYGAEGQDCTEIRHPSATEWRFTAPAFTVGLEGPEGCSAKITRSIKERGQTMTQEFSGASAPFEITTLIP